MPIINVHLFSGRTLEQKRQLVKEMTEVVCRALGNKPESVKIILSEMERDDYAIGGILKIDQEK